MYGGTRRSSDEVVHVSASDGPNGTYCNTNIIRVDGTKVDGGKFELLPGLHSVRVESKAKQPNQMIFIPIPAVGVIGGAVIGAIAGATAATAGAAKPTQAFDPLTVCFLGQPGHDYVVRTLVENDLWEIEVIDDETDVNVKTPCDSRR